MDVSVEDPYRVLDTPDPEVRIARALAISANALVSGKFLWSVG